MLLSGHHEEIRKWRRKAAEEKTARMRPDLIAKANSADGTNSDIKED
jgi:tRNA (guanine37-N1)-methyltransferase